MGRRGRPLGRGLPGGARRRMRLPRQQPCWAGASYERGSRGRDLTPVRVVYCSADQATPLAALPRGMPCCPVRCYRETPIERFTRAPPTRHYSHNIPRIVEAEHQPVDFCIVPSVSLGTNEPQGHHAAGEASMLTHAVQCHAMPCYASPARELVAQWLDAQRKTP